MSSLSVRDKVLAFLTDQFPAERVVDISAEYSELDDFLIANNITSDQNWLGIQYIGNEEIPVDVGATNTRGKYREIGIFYLHVVEVARLGVARAVLQRGEAIRNAVRGQRIDGDVVVKSVSPVNFGPGITLSFQGGYSAGLIIVEYQYDLDL